MVNPDIPDLETMFVKHNAIFFAALFTTFGMQKDDEIIFVSG